MKYIYLLFFFFFGLIARPAFAQAGGHSPIENFETFYKNNYQESIFVHADKDYYLTGEFVKFKVYCLERLTEKPSRLSRVAYVEILDSQNTPMLQTRIELKKGAGYGELYIPMKVNSGNFIIRAYTRWMRNYGPETYYHAMIQIINPFRKLGLKPASDTLAIEFYPEGGKLIHGVESNIVFHGKSKLGIPQQVEGRLMANDTMVVAEFKSIKNGLGHFSFTPDLLQKYHVELRRGDENLPHHFIPVQRRGLSVQIRHRANSYELDIFCNETSIIKPDEFVYVILHQKGEVLFSREISLPKGRAQLPFDASLVNGVARLSLLNSTGELLAERILFKQQRNEKKPELLTEKAFMSRSKIDLDLGELADAAEISVSVSATHSAFGGHMPGMDDYLLLDNSLKYIYGIETYLDGSPEQVDALINDLLIAYPSRPNTELFTSAGKKIDFVPEHRSVLVTGRLKEKQTNEAAFGILTYLSVPGKITQIYASKSDVDGALVFESGNFYGSNQVVVQNDYTKDTTYTIDIDNPYSEEYADISLPVFDLDEQLADLIRRKSQQMQVQNANIRLSPNSEVISEQDSASFYIEADSKYLLDDYTRFVVMEEVMREYISGVNVRKNRDGFHFMVIDIERNIIYDENPLMLLDGVPVFDADEIIAIDPLKIQKIETVKSGFGRGVLDCKGIVTYTSYAADLAGHKIHDEARVFDYDGLQPVKSYFFPSYSSAFERQNPTPDFRSNLYWLPNAADQLAKTGTLEFYTSDEADSFEVVINGLNQHGEVVSLTDTFTVKRQKID
jgi:hypothetical protein